MQRINDDDGTSVKTKETCLQKPHLLQQLHHHQHHRQHRHHHSRHCLQHTASAPLPRLHQTSAYRAQVGPLQKGFRACINNMLRASIKNGLERYY